MGLPDDLLDVALGLTRSSAGRPRQANLRRAISTAYYALFHLLTEEALALLTTRQARQGKIARAFEHRNMKDASRAFGGPNASNYTKFAIPTDLVLVARTFEQMQEQRHAADYDIDARYSLQDAHAMVQQVKDAFDAWRRVRQDDAAIEFLSAMLFWKTWRR